MPRCVRSPHSATNSTRNVETKAEPNISFAFAFATSAAVSVFAHQSPYEIRRNDKVETRAEMDGPGGENREQSAGCDRDPPLNRQG